MLDDQGDDMNAEQERMLREVHAELTGGRDAPSADGRTTIRTRTWQSNAALGRIEKSVAAEVAAEVVGQLPAGTVDVDVLAGKVADVIFSRVGDA